MTPVRAGPRQATRGRLLGAGELGDDRMIRSRIACCFAAALALGACADPLADFDRLSDVPLAQGADAAAVAAGPADTADAPLALPTLLAGILGPRTAPASPVAPAGAVDAAVTEAAIGAGDVPGPLTEARTAIDAQTVPDAAEGAELITVAATAPAEAPGLFSGLFGGGSATNASQVTDAPEADTGLAPGTVQIPGSAPLPPGATVPYGVIATVCGLDAGALGRSVETASGYTVHDTNPSSTAPRTQYITGFADGCARQFFGTLALFGDIGTHEIVRYSPGIGDGYSATDTAYEQIKAAYCGVAARTPCGARLEALALRTTFLTIYETFGTSNGWADVLLSDGEVIADDF